MENILKVLRESSSTMYTGLSERAQYELSPQEVRYRVYSYFTCALYTCSFLNIVFNDGDVRILKSHILPTKITAALKSRLVTIRCMGYTVWQFLRKHCYIIKYNSSYNRNSQVRDLRELFSIFCMGSGDRISYLVLKKALKTMGFRVKDTELQGALGRFVYYIATSPNPNPDTYSNKNRNPYPNPNANTNL